MKAVYISQFGSLDDLGIREVPEPSAPTGSGVLVKVRAAGLNRADLLQAKGLYPPPAEYSPNIPGLEFAGEIVAIGDKVTSLAIGDRVLGITAGEGQAEFLVTDSRHLARIPDNLSYNEAAAVPEGFITAHDAVFTQGKLLSGETLLVHAVGSGVGLAALQLAKAAGATVIGTSRTADKLGRCDVFGLDGGILTKDGSDFLPGVLDVTDGRGAEVILDLVGGSYFEQNLRALGQNGRLLLVGLTAGRRAEFDLGLALQKRATIIGTVLRSRSPDEKASVTKRFSEHVLPLLANGYVVPNLDKVYSSSDVKAAYDHLASNTAFGKVVLQF